MKKNFLLITLLLLFTSTIFAYSPFNIPKNCKDVTVFFRDNNSPINESESFYIDDLDLIRELQKEWDFTKRMSYVPYFDSGVHNDYDIYIIIDGQMSETVTGFNLEKGIFANNLKLYKFDPELWTKLKQKAKKAVLISNTYENVSDFRTALNNYKSSPDFIFETVSKPYACDYDGFFYISDYNWTWSSLNRKLKRKYPKEKFEITEENASGFKIASTKSFYTSFDLNEKSEFESFTNIRLYVFMK